MLSFRYVVSLWVMRDAWWLYWVLGCLWGSLGALKVRGPWGSLKALGGFMGALMGPLGPLGGSLGLSRVHGASGGRVPQCLWGVLGALGVSLGTLGGSLGALEGSLSLSGGP